MAKPQRSGLESLGHSVTVGKTILSRGKVTTTDFIGLSYQPASLNHMWIRWKTIFNRINTGGRSMIWLSFQKECTKQPQKSWLSQLPSLLFFGNLFFVNLAFFCKQINVTFFFAFKNDNSLQEQSKIISFYGFFFVSNL